VSLTPDKLYRLVPEPFVFTHAIVPPSSSIVASIAPSIVTRGTSQLPNATPQLVSTTSMSEQASELLPPSLLQSSSSSTAMDSLLVHGASNVAALCMSPSSISVVTPSGLASPLPQLQQLSVADGNDPANTNTSTYVSANRPTATTTSNTHGMSNHRYRVGEFHSLCVTVTHRAPKHLHKNADYNHMNDNTDNVLPNEWLLELLPYQETIAGGRDTNVQHKLMWLGSLIQPFTPVCYVRIIILHIQHHNVLI
jgi:hypothetical protein